VFELARGGAGRLTGYLTGLLVTLKGLPSAYDKDLQEDKLPVFNAFDLMVKSLRVLAGALETLMINPQRLQANLDPGMMAADAADYLVEKGVPFREAHALIGEIVNLAAGQGIEINQLSLEELRSIHPAIEDGFYGVFDPQRSVARRKASGGTAPEAVREQIDMCRKVMGG
jgi:argininosuccinate lyase